MLYGILMTIDGRFSPDVPNAGTNVGFHQGALRDEGVVLAGDISSTLANVIGIELEQFVPVPSKSAHSAIRHASGVLKILLLEDTTIPVESIQSFLGISGAPTSLINSAGVFKDRLLLGISPHRVISPETSRLQLDTVETMLGLVQRRRLIPKPYTGKQRSVTGLGPFPTYELRG